MKIDRHGKAKILTPEEIQLLFNHGTDKDRDQVLFGICLYTGCRINESVTLQKIDVYDPYGQVRPELIIRKKNTKNKLATRTIPVLEELRLLLSNYQTRYDNPYLFPGKGGKGHLHPDSGARLLKQACQRIGLIGISSHSFRRTALTQMSNAGIPLRIIQEISGHRNLEQLQRYLEVKPEQVRGAIASLSMLSHIPRERDGISDITEIEQPSSMDLNSYKQ
ncbi:site-specific recombinase XerD [Xenococcus sp. PCC 7305]|uniref:tyrosine-type recombinase/integrase n=1 Tax=Xenococcus sp. PCC 7305 TaxID=102125 RepID=UPI0002AC816F|nr:site-specific integrase [Xenococcus sp. PCC 7305]ELS05120.1 site-specific recombinase XerD [Xenococcus sp. PCC 7305]